MINYNLITKDYLKQIFANKKTLFKTSEIKTCNPARYDEISVAQLYDPCIKMPGMAQYFPDQYPKVSLYISDLSFVL